MLREFRLNTAHHPFISFETYYFASTFAERTVHFLKPFSRSDMGQSYRDYVQCVLRHIIKKRQIIYIYLRN